MKIEKEIKGEIFCSSINEFYVKLKLRDERLDWFELDLVNKEIQSHLEKGTQILLGISTYDDYIRLIKDLGLKLPVHLGYKEHWTPKFNEYYVFVDSNGITHSHSIDKTGYHTADIKKAEYYNMFPTYGLAKKVVNLSKLDRLILLWQYANDCLFEPDWGDDSQVKYKVVFDSYTNSPDIDLSFYVKENRIYFKTRKQAKAFVEMYKKEIKDTMEI